MKTPDRDAQGHFLSPYDFRAIDNDYLKFGFEKKVEGIFWDIAFFSFVLVLFTGLLA